MPELAVPTAEIVDKLSTPFKDPSSGKWIISLEQYYMKQNLCKVDPGCILIPTSK